MDNGSRNDAADCNSSGGTEVTAAADDLSEVFFPLKDSVFDLRVGAPGPDILCKLAPMFTEATRERMAAEAEHGHLFQYGPEPGQRSFRRALAHFLSQEYAGQPPVDEEELFVTTGATNGLFMICTLLLHPTAVVFVENPTYFIGLKLLSQDLGLRVVPVPMNNDGIDIDALERCVKEATTVVKGNQSDNGKFHCMLYTIPNFHNPTGITFTTSTCREIIRISGEQRMLVVCDDVYNLLDYRGLDKPQTSRLKALDTNDLVISNGTFSKILAPGLRLGWLELPRRLLPWFTGSGVLLSGGCQNNYTSGILHSLINNGVLSGLLNQLRQTYGVRMNASYACLSKNLPAGWRLIHPGGGYFLWIQADTDLTEFCQKLTDEFGVMVITGRETCPFTHLGVEMADGNLSHAFRISIAHYEQEKLVEACSAICRAANEHVKDMANV